MPRLTWTDRGKPELKPEVNHLAAVFRAYRKSSGMSSEKIGEALGVTAENARYQMNKPGRYWNVGQLCRYCDVLGIPYEEAFRAATE